MTGAVLAGGRGSRMGGHKAVAKLGGRSLIDFPLAALGQVCDRVAVVCKGGTELPELPAGVERWEEPEEPRHPAAGIAHALERSGGEVLVCPTDMPLVGAAELEALLAAAAAASPSVSAAVARMGDWLVPVLGVYRAKALEPLRRAAASGAPLREAVATLGPAVVELAPSPSVDRAEDLADVESRLSA